MNSVSEADKVKIDRYSNIRFYKHDRGNFVDSIGLWTYYPASPRPRKIIGWLDNAPPHDELSIYATLNKDRFIIPDSPIFSFWSFRSQKMHAMVYTLTAKFNEELCGLCEAPISTSEHVVIVLYSLFFHPMLFRQLMVLMLASVTKHEVKNDESLENFVKQISGIKGGKIFQFFDSHPIEISPFREFGRLLHYAFSIFNITQIMTILNVLLVGQRIVVVSSTCSDLGPACYMLLALMAPLENSTLFSSITPDDMDSVFEIPTNFVLGMTRKYLSRHLPRDYSEIFIIDVEHGITHTGHLPNRSKRIGKLDEHIYKLLLKEKVFWRETNYFNTLKIIKILNTYIFGMLALSTNMTPNLINSPDSLKDLSFRIQNTTAKEVTEFEKCLLQSQSVLDFSTSLLTYERSKLAGYQMLFSNTVAFTIQSLTS